MRFQRKRLINSDDFESFENSKIELRKDSLSKKEKHGWGKKERIFVFLILGITSVGAFLLAFVSRLGKLPNLPRITSESIGLSDTVILSKTEVPINIQKRNNDIIKKFSDTVSSLSGIYAFVVVDLKSGDTYGLNEFEPMQAASLIKLPVMTLLLKQADDGKLNLDSTYILKNSDKTPGSGSLIGSPEGTILTYRRLLQYMGHESDNTAFTIVRNYLGDENINAFAASIGMKSTDIEENMTSPSDVALLFEKIYNGRILSTKSKDLLFDSLTKTIYESYLPQGVPPDTRIAHKYGSEVHVLNDAGVVFSTSPYIVVLMTGGIVESEAQKTVPLLSQLIYEGQSQ